METTSSSSSLVSKAKFAFHSAAAKAEKVLTDLKTDHHNREIEEQQSHDISKNLSNFEENHVESDNEIKHLKWKPVSLGRKHDWQEKLRNIRRGKKEIEEKEREKEKAFNFISDFLDQDNDTTSQIDIVNVTIEKSVERELLVKDEEELSPANMVSIPPTSIIKQLATAIESGKKLNTMKDLLASSRSSSPVRERGGLSFSAMKSLVLREKEDKATTDLHDDDEFLPSLVQSLFKLEGHFPRRNNTIDSATPSLPREIHGSPPESIVVKLSEIIGGLKTLRKMALFWCKVIAELRRLWYEGQPVPCVPLDESPDLNFCLLHQQLQVINCCISRKKRRALASEILHSIIGESTSNSEEVIVSPEHLSSNPSLYAKVSTGDYVLRLGADRPADKLTMLETGEPIYAPVTQEGPILTEDLIKEAEEFVLRTGSCGAGCSQLLSDMQAFKAANPGCILEDFVRWHSPPDWSRNDPEEAKDSRSVQDLTSKRGQLSSRMQKEGNLWRELWDTAKPLPALQQNPLFDEDLAVEGILNYLEEITPFELFRQLFISLVSSGFVIAEGAVSPNSDLSKLFYECKDYVIAACQGGSWADNNLDDLCQVYETVESILVYPKDCLKIINQPDETPAAAGIDEPKRRFKKLSLNFGGGKDRQFLRKPAALFSRRPPKPTTSAASSLDENDWTIV
ncbi:hypothetical protein ACHQM5_002891 [Ranunculus cassubicifolius]